MTSPVVNTLPSAPSRNQSPDAFVETADTWVAALPSWTTSVNTLGSWMNTTAAAVDADASTASTAASVAQTAASNAVNAPGTSATSTTPLTPSIASKSLTIQTGKAFSVGQFVVIADTANPTTNYMIGNITSYNSGTGALVVNVTNSAGVAASAWTISLTGAPAQNSLSNNLTFLGSGRRIYGDLSNATISNRLLVQNSVAGASSNLGVIPNGAATTSSITAFNNSNADQASTIVSSVDTNAAYIYSSRTGTASYLPLVFVTNASERFRLTTDGKFQADFSNATLSNRLLFQSSTVNNATSIGAIPNGTSSYANFTAFASSNPDQSALIQIAASNTEVIINSTRTGTASYLPLTFYTNNTKQWTIDSAGRMQNTSKTMPHVWARRGITAQTSGSTVLFDVVEENTGGAYNSSTGEFTVPVSGYYDFSVAVGVSKISAGSTSFSIGLYRVSDSKGFGLPACQLAGNNQINTVTISGSAYLNAGDVIKVGGGGSFTSDLVVAGGSLAAVSSSHFYMKLVR